MVLLTTASFIQQATRLEQPPNRRLDRLISQGFSLASLGVTEHALSALQMDGLLEEAIRSNVAVLGGDVYYQSNVGICPGSESWFCDRLDDERYSEYVARSVQVASKYISDYNCDGPFTVLFAPVLDD